MKRTLTLLLIHYFFSYCNPPKRILDTIEDLGILQINVPLINKELSHQIVLKLKGKTIQKLDFDQSSPSFKNVEKLPSGIYSIEIKTKWRDKTNYVYVNNIEVKPNKISYLSTLASLDLFRLSNLQENWDAKFIEVDQQNLTGAIRISFSQRYDLLTPELASDNHAVSDAPMSLNDSTIIYYNLNPGFYEFGCHIEFPYESLNCPVVYGIYVQPRDTANISITGFSTLQSNNSPLLIRWSGDPLSQ